MKEKALTTAQSRGHEILESITSEISKVVIGKDEMKKLLLVALLSQGHVLIEGLPGTAKTTLARTFAQVIGGKFKRVQGTPDMLPADILGFHLYRPDGGSSLVPGPIFANVILADELNRTTARTQSALLEAMQENQVTIEQETYPLEQPFIVIASQVPYGGPGTSPLSDVQIDRFMFRIWSTFPSKHEERQVLRDIDQILEPQVSPVATLDDIIQLQQEVKKVHVADNVTHYIVDILSNLRHHQDVVLGPSSRGGVALFKGARALAFVEGRDFVTPDDVKRLLIPALCHRLPISPEAEMDKVTPEAIINQVTAEIPVPKGEGVSPEENTEANVSELPRTASGSTEEAVSLTEATAETGNEEPQALNEAPDATTTIAGEPHQETVAQVELPPEKTEAAPARLNKPTGIMFTDWEWAVIILALVVAVIMISLGLLSLR